jgi:hypothetical protein
MRGQAALAMWWDMAPAVREEFEHWHSHEHFVERLALPGFQRASRWADAGGGEGFFVLYELDAYEALSSADYRGSLNAPSEWSRKLMPHHRNMVRSPCRVLAGGGAAIAGCLLTLRLSPQPGAHTGLREHLEGLVNELPGQAGLSGSHLLATDTSALGPTTETRIRGDSDRAADWILLVMGYEVQALHALLQGSLSAPALHAAGAVPSVVAGRYLLRHSLTAQEAWLAQPGHPTTRSA